MSLSMYPFLPPCCLVQAEAGELAKKVQSLTAENMTLKSEISKLSESSEQLKLENATMLV